MTDRVRKACFSQPELLGVAWYLELCHRFTRIFLVKSRTTQQILEDCGWCLAFMGYWDMAVTHDNTCDKTVNFITLETKMDLVMLLQAVVLTIKLFGMYFPNVKLSLSRFSSRFAEYAFQRLRLGIRSNDNRISALSGLHRTELMQGMLLEDFSKDQVFQMRNKRGMVEGKTAIDPSWNNAPDGYYPSFDEQVKYFDVGAQQVVAMLKKEIVTCGAGGAKWVPWHALPPHVTAFEVMASKHLITPKHNKHKLTGEGWAELFSLNTRNKGSSGVDDELPDPIVEDKEYAHDDADEYMSELGSGASHHMASRLGDLSLGGDEASSSGFDAKGKALRNVKATTVRRSTRIALTMELQDDDIDTEKHMQHEECKLGCQASVVEAMRDILENKLSIPDQTKTELVIVEQCLRELARAMNGLWKPKENTRRIDRFLPPMLWDRVEWKSSGGVLEDEDILALLIKVDNKYVLRFGQVEKCYRKVSKAVVNCHCLWVDDPHGYVMVRLFETLPDKKGGVSLYAKGALKGRKFTLPIKSKHALLAIECRNVLAAVAMMLPVKDVTTVGGAQVESYEDFWVLPEEDYTVALDMYNSWRLRKDENDQNE